MSQLALLKRTARLLEQIGAGYMLTGSLVSSMQGEPRSTHDIDLVVSLPSTLIDALLAGFPANEFYLSAEAVRQAVAQRGMFNLLDTREGDKIDFWMLTDEPFDQSRFARKLRVDLEGTELWISTPEDTIVMKLRWSRESGRSAKHLRDAQSVYRLQRASLDVSYLEWWTAELGLTQEWQQLLAAVQRNESA